MSVADVAGACGFTPTKVFRGTCLRGAVGVHQIALLSDDPSPVLAGVRALGAEHVSVLGRASSQGVYEKLSELLDGAARHDFQEIPGHPLLGTIHAVRRLAQEPPGRFSDVLVNVGGADRSLACAALSAAFMSGVKAFDVEHGRIQFLPVLKFSMREVVSEAKVGILRALDRAGGSCDRLKTLAREARLQDSLVSYHIRGGREGRGLEELGLVTLERGQRGALTIRLTPMGELIARGLGP